MKKKPVTVVGHFSNEYKHSEALLNLVMKFWDSFFSEIHLLFHFHVFTFQ